MHQVTGAPPADMDMSIEEIGELIEHARQQHIEESPSPSAAFDALAMAVELLRRALASHIAAASSDQ